MRRIRGALLCVLWMVALGFHTTLLLTTGGSVLAKDWWGEKPLDAIDLQQQPQQPHHQYTQPQLQLQPHHTSRDRWSTRETETPTPWPEEDFDTTPTTPVSPNPNESDEWCLFFTNSNSKVVVLKEEEGQYRGTELMTTLVRGYAPTGIAVYDDVVYVASIRQIERYSMVNLYVGRNPDVTIFVDFYKYLSNFSCSPQALRAYHGVLYVACATGNPFSILKFALTSGPGYSYGDFLNGLKELPDVVISDMLIAYRNTSEARLFFVEQVSRRLYSCKIANTDPKDPLTLDGKGALAEAAPIDGSVSTVWRGMATDFPQQDYLYIVEFASFPKPNDNSSILQSPKQNQLQRYNISDYSFIDVFASYNSTLVDATTLCFHPTSAYAVLLVSGLEAPSSLYTVRMDGNVSNTFYGDSSDEIYPQFCQWHKCPILHQIPPHSGSDGLEDYAVTFIIVFPVLTIFMFCCLLVCFTCLYFGINKYKARRRFWDEESDSRFDSGTALNEFSEYSYKEINPKDLEFREELGHGAYGHVYRGLWRGAPVAIKTVESVSLEAADEQTMKLIREEAQLMAKLGNHPNIVTLIGAVTKKSSERAPQEDTLEGVTEHFPKRNQQNTLCIVLEYCPKGSLYDCIIKRREKIPLALLIRIACDAANGILHLHKENMIHRDIAARNILVGNNYEVYISDFGMARLREEGGTHTTRSTIGPVAWMAPESMLKREYSQASDVFSFGVFLWEIVTKKEPWKGMEPMQIVVLVSKKNTRLKVPSDCDPVIRNIINACWMVKPEKRPTMEQIADKLRKYKEKLENLYADFYEDDSDKSSPNLHFDTTPLGSTDSTDVKPRQFHDSVEMQVLTPTSAQPFDTPVNSSSSITSCSAHPFYTDIVMEQGLLTGDDRDYTHSSAEPTLPSGANRRKRKDISGNNHANSKKQDKKGKEKSAPTPSSSSVSSGSEYVNGGGPNLNIGSEIRTPTTHNPLGDNNPQPNPDPDRSFYQDIVL